MFQDQIVTWCNLHYVSQKCILSSLCNICLFLWNVADFRMIFSPYSMPPESLIFIAKVPIIYYLNIGRRFMERSVLRLIVLVNTVMACVKGISTYVNRWIWVIFLWRIFLDPNTQVWSIHFDADIESLNYIIFILTVLPRMIPLTRIIASLE